MIRVLSRCMALSIALAVPAQPTFAEDDTLAEGQGCNFGPVERTIAEASWQVQSCDDGRSLVFWPSENVDNPFSTYYIQIWFENQRYRMWIEGDEDAEAVQAAYEALKTYNTDMIYKFAVDAETASHPPFPDHETLPEWMGAMGSFGVELVLTAVTPTEPQATTGAGDDVRFQNFESANKGQQVLGVQYITGCHFGQDTICQVASIFRVVSPTGVEVTRSEPFLVSSEKPLGERLKTEMSPNFFGLDTNQLTESGTYRFEAVTYDLVSGAVVTITRSIDINIEG